MPKNFQKPIEKCGWLRQTLVHRPVLRLSFLAKKS